MLTLYYSFFPYMFMRTDGRKDGQTDRYDEANRRFSQFCEKRLKAGSYVQSKPRILKFKRRDFKLAFQLLDYCRRIE